MVGRTGVPGGNVHTGLCRSNPLAEKSVSPAVPTVAFPGLTMTLLQSCSSFEEYCRKVNERKTNKFHEICHKSLLKTLKQYCKLTLGKLVTFADCPGVLIEFLVSTFDADGVYSEFLV